MGFRADTFFLARKADGTRMLRFSLTGLRAVVNATLDPVGQSTTALAS